MECKIQSLLSNVFVNLVFIVNICYTIGIHIVPYRFKFKMCNVMITLINYCICDYSYLLYF